MRPAICCGSPPYGDTTPGVDCCEPYARANVGGRVRWWRRLSCCMLVVLLEVAPCGDVAEWRHIAARRFVPSPPLPLPVAGHALTLHVRHAVRAKNGEAGAHELTANPLPALRRLDVEPFHKTHGRRPADGARANLPHEQPHGRAIGGQHGDQTRILRKPRGVARGNVSGGLGGVGKLGVGHGKGRLMLANQGREQELEVMPVARRGGANHETHVRPPATSFGRGAVRRRRRRLRGAAGGSTASSTGAGAVGAVGVWSTAGRSATPARTASSGKAWCTRKGTQPRACHCASPATAASSTCDTPSASRSETPSATSSRARPRPRCAGAI